MCQQPPARLFLRITALVLSFVLAGANWGQAQGSGENRPPDTAPSGPETSTQGAAQPAGKRMTLSPPAPRPLGLGSLTVSGSLRIRAEAWDWFAGDAENTSGLFPKLTLRSEAHALRLASARDLWYQDGGADPTHTFGYTGRSGYGNRGLGNYWDAGAGYAISPPWAACVYFGNAWGRGVTQSPYPKNPNVLFGYSELTLKF